jgi:hypothetical protein
MLPLLFPTADIKSPNFHLRTVKPRVAIHLPVYNEICNSQAVAAAPGSGYGIENVKSY